MTKGVVVALPTSYTLLHPRERSNRVATNNASGMDMTLDILAPTYENDGLANTIEGLRLDLPGQFDKHWFINELLPSLGPLVNLRRLQIHALCTPAVLQIKSVEHDSILLAHEFTSCVRRLTEHHQSLETCELVFTPCKHAMSFSSFEQLRAAMPCEWANAVCYHHLNIKRYRNSAVPVVRYREGTKEDMRGFFREGPQIFRTVNSSCRVPPATQGPGHHYMKAAR